jgi:hypothetical protein
VEFLSKTAEVDGASDNLDIGGFSVTATHKLHF